MAGFSKKQARIGDLVKAPDLREDGGTVTIFSLFLVIVFAMVMGMAIDVMIAQYEQTRLQATADRAALAAADLDQSLGPREVVESYFETAGLREHLQDVQLPDEGSSTTRRVKVVTSNDVRTSFMHLLDVDVLPVAGVAEARDAFDSVEISLVLDISGSMRFATADGSPRIELLKPAASDFVERVLSQGNADKVTISLVPYAGQVNPGPRLFELLGGERVHTASSCLEMTKDDFDDLRLPSQSSLQVPHFMNWTIDRGFMDWGWCPSDATAILPLSSDADALKTAINAMRLHDGTGTTYAVKWGLALLDPSSRGTVATLRSEGIAGTHSDGRPRDYEDNVRKIVVLMTDGIITEQVRPRWTSGVLWTGDPAGGKEVSPVAEFVPGYSSSPNDARQAIAAVRKGLNDFTGAKTEREATLSTPLGYVQLHSTSKLNTVQRLIDHYAKFERDYEVTYDFARLDTLDPSDAMTVKTRERRPRTLSASQIQAAFELGYLNHWEINKTVELENQYNHNGSKAGSAFREHIANASYFVGAFKALCREAKDKEIEVFTIAFEAPRDAQNQMRSCATNEADYYYEVNSSDGGSLANAFNDIAASISELRLIQ